jgi:hypothetical protein
MYRYEFNVDAELFLTEAKDILYKKTSTIAEVSRKLKKNAILEFFVCSCFLYYLLDSSGRFHFLVLIHLF